MRQVIRFAVVGAAFTALGVAVGCRPAQPTAPDPMPGGKYPQMVSMKGLGDAVVAQFERIVEEMPVPAQGKVLRVTVPVRNNIRREMRVQYRYLFMDAQGRPVERNEVGWKYQVLPPGVERFLEGNALDTTAVDWRLEIRPAQ